MISSQLKKNLCAYFFKYISYSLVFKTARVVIKVSKLVSRLASLLLKISDYNWGFEILSSSGIPGGMIAELCSWVLKGKKEKKLRVTEQTIRKLMYPPASKAAFPLCDTRKEELLLQALLVSGCCFMCRTVSHSAQHTALCSLGMCCGLALKMWKPTGREYLWGWGGRGTAFCGWQSSRVCGNLLVNDREVCNHCCLIPRFKRHRLLL